MGRWRPPQPRSSKYITSEGYQRLNQELKYLWKVKRPEITQSVKEAAAQGDRSENAEYIYGKKQLREIDRRVRYLSKRLEDMVVVDRAPDPDKRDTVFFGAWVTLLDENEQEKCHRIVGPDEIDAGSDYISMDSPLARLLLKKQLGDEICLIKPDGNEVWYEIIKVDYEGS
ncbi:transcription elongation factor GreB [Neptuniibacter sp.]|uniref:transcription elongation factor GreB n=1 Tax=Neptuniibacter sp. TaxID=1962643 RepID=UPI003B5B7172